MELNGKQIESLPFHSLGIEKGKEDIALAFLYRKNTREPPGDTPEVWVKKSLTRIFGL